MTGAAMRDVFLCEGKRTPIGRYGGALAALRPDDMAAQVIDALLAGRDLPVEEVILGCANQGGRGQPQRGAHGRAPLAPARDGAGADGEPALRLGPRRGDPGRAARCARAPTS